MGFGSGAVTRLGAHALMRALQHGCSTVAGCAAGVTLTPALSRPHLRLVRHAPPFLSSAGYLPFPLGVRALLVFLRTGVDLLRARGRVRGRVRFRVRARVRFRVRVRFRGCPHGQRVVMVDPPPRVDHTCRPSPK